MNKEIIKIDAIKEQTISNNPKSSFYAEIGIPVETQWAETQRKPRAKRTGIIMRYGWEFQWRSPLWEIKCTTACTLHQPATLVSLMINLLQASSPLHKTFYLPSHCLDTAIYQYM